MSDRSYPSSEPTEFAVMSVEAEDECYITILLRNGRVTQVGGTTERPVLVRAFIEGDEWRAVVDDLLHRLKEQVDGLSVRYVGEGFDPVMYPPDDKEAIDSAEAHAVVVAVPPAAQADVRRVVTDLTAPPRTPGHLVPRHAARRSGSPSCRGAGCPDGDLSQPGGASKGGLLVRLRRHPPRSGRHGVSAAGPAPPSAMAEAARSHRRVPALWRRPTGPSRRQSHRTIRGSEQRRQLRHIRRASRRPASAQLQRATSDARRGPTVV